jgi:hypothetical protein
VKILIPIIIVSVFFMLGQFRALSVAGINPNLLLIALFFFAVRADRFSFLGVLLAVSAVLVFLFTPFWIIQYLVVLLIVLVFYFLFIKNLMTGNRLFDFLIAVVLGTFLFYLVVGFFSFGLPKTQILWEMLYNLAVGVLLWGGARRLSASS